METMTTVVFGVQAKSPAPLFRVVGGAAVSSYRPVAGLLGQECAGFSGLSVSGLGGWDLTGYAGGVRLVEHALAGHVLAEAPRSGEQVPAERVETRALLKRTGGTGFSSNDGIFSDNGSTDGGNGSQPMSPWGYRTSSPPG